MWALIPLFAVTLLLAFSGNVSWSAEHVSDTNNALPEVRKKTRQFR